MNLIRFALVILSLLLTLSLNAQEYITPDNAITFSLNNHTNRDISYFSKVDSNNNPIIIGTTERDSTFTDILTTKFDQNLNIIWQHTYSVETSLSYDIPIKTIVDNNDDIYISLRSSSDNSSQNGYPFLIKYDQSGLLLWELNITEFLEIDSYDFKIYNTYLNNDGTLNVIYSPYNYFNTPDVIYFLKIDDNGSIINNYQTTIDSDFTLESYNNGMHYLFYVTLNNPETLEYDYNFRTIDFSNDNQYTLSDEPSFPSNLNFSNYEEINLTTDNNGNNYVSWQETYNPQLEPIYSMKIDNSGNMEYVINTDSDIDSYLITSFINANNNLIIVSNSIEPNSSALKFNLKEYNQEGTLINDVFDINANAGSVKINDDKSIFVFANDQTIKLYNENLSFVNSFAGLEINFGDIAKIDDDEIVIARTTLEKMYPESDFFTQLDIVVEKLDTSGLLNSYNFSGIGTSKAWNQTIKMDHDNNYIIYSEEKLGPDNFSIGGSRAPILNRLQKYDTNFNLLWSINLSNSLIPYAPVIGENFIIDENNNIYINSRVNDSQNIELLKFSESGTLTYSVSSYYSIALFLDQNENINLVSGLVPNPQTYENDLHIYTFSVANGTLLNETVFGGQEFLQQFLYEGKSIFYIYEPDYSGELNSKKVLIYENMFLNSEIDLNLPSNYSNVDEGVYKLDNEFNFYFSSSFGSNDEKIHKIEPNYNYSSIDINEGINKIRVLGNNKIVTLNGEQELIIYDENLSALASLTNPTFYNNSNLYTKSNLIFISDFNGNYNVLNDDLLIIDQIRIQGGLTATSAIVEPSSGQIVTTGSIGNQIFTFQEYSWRRAFLHKFTYNGPQDDDNDGIGNAVDLCPDTSTGEEVDTNGCSSSQTDSDLDGVFDNVDECPDTAENTTVNDVGCAENQLDDDGDGITNDLDLCPDTVLIDYINDQGCFNLASNNFLIESRSETCVGQNNGQIYIQTVESLDYSATINGNDYNFNDELLIENLPPGNHELCITVDSDNYQQCFNIEILNGITILGRFGITSNNLEINIDEGTKPYKVFVNGVFTFETNFNTFSFLVNHNDIVQVNTSKSCEGTIKKTINLSEQVIATPNPSKGAFEIILPYNLDLERIPVSIYNIQSQLISELTYQIIDNKITLDIENKGSGIYFAKIGGENLFIKLIKN
jgi:hypothetical protein